MNCMHGPCLMHANINIFGKILTMFTTSNIPVWLSASTFQWAACGRHYFLLQLKPIKIKYQMQVKLSSRCSFREVHVLSQEKEDYMTSAI